VKTQQSKGASCAHDRKDGGALCAAVLATRPQFAANNRRSSGKEAAAISALMVLGLLAGCGGSGSDTNAASEQPPRSETVAETAPPTTPAPATPTPEPAEDATDSTPTPPPVSASADVLLLKPAGTTELPSGLAPSVKFKPLESPEDQSATDTGVDSSGNPVAANGPPLLSSSSTGPSAAVTVSWDPPNQNADGSSLDDLAGYRVYQGNEEQLSIVQELNETGAGERRLAQIPDVTEANSCFAVTAYDTSGNESALGEVICKDAIIPAPATNRLAPALTAVTQLSTNDGLASVSLRWQPPIESSASAGASIVHYSLYHGNQSQLFKITEVTEESARDGSDRSHIITGIGGEQACFALTARYTDGNETSLGEIVCVALVHSTPPEPGAQLRPYNLTVVIGASNVAQVAWDKPNTVVSSADATAIDRYDLYQGSASQVFKISEIEESGAAGTRRSVEVENVFSGSNCFALTATDQSQRQSALSTIVCGSLPDSSGSAAPTLPITGTLGVTELTAMETSPGSVAISWDAPELVAAGQSITNLRGYNLYQGSSTQLFKVAEVAHSPNTVRQQYQRTGVESNNACFAATAYDNNGFESPLSEVVCVVVSGAASVPQFGIVPPTELATSALGGSTTVVLTWLASGAAISGSADPNVDRYNIYQGDHDRLFKVREVESDLSIDSRATTTFTGVSSDSVCFAITAQYIDLRESRLSDIVCRDD